LSQTTTVVRVPVDPADPVVQRLARVAVLQGPEEESQAPVVA
jgi:hypothetical protein